jgi:hypothetical protein
MRGLGDCGGARVPERRHRGLAGEHDAGDVERSRPASAHRVVEKRKEMIEDLGRATVSVARDESCSCDEVRDFRVSG